MPNPDLASFHRDLGIESVSMSLRKNFAALPKLEFRGRELEPILGCCQSRDLPHCPGTLQGAGDLSLPRVAVDLGGNATSEKEREL